jgi:hypothetical protein
MQNHTTDVEQIYKSYGIPISEYQNLERSNEIKLSQSKWNFLQSENTAQSESLESAFATLNSKTTPSLASLKEE